MTLEGIRETWDISGSVKDDTLVIKHFRITPIFKNLKMYIHNFDNPEIGK